jgi:hypothetical protein
MDMEGGSSVQALVRRVRDNAAHYFPDFGSGEVRAELVGSRTGALSSVHRVRLRTAGRERVVVVKQVPLERGAARGSSRARVAPALDPRASFESERATLPAIERHFASLGDARFGSVGLLDALPDHRVLVMEEQPAPTLRDLLARAHRLRHPRGARTLEPVFGNAGAWLRAFHGLSPLPHTRVRHATRDEFVATVRGLCEFLAVHGGEAAFLDSVGRAASAAAHAVLPSRLPLGTAHGDMAPRNVLVDASGRVTVLDTRAAWSAPIHEDIAYFVTALRTSRAQAYSFGLAFGPSALGRYERAFLRGYFGGEPPCLASIRLFELESLLDRWSARASEPARGAAPGAAVGRWSVVRLLRREVALASARVDAALAT